MAVGRPIDPSLAAAGYPRSASGETVTVSSLRKTYYLPDGGEIAIEGRLAPFIELGVYLLVPLVVTLAVVAIGASAFLEIGPKALGYV